MPDADRRNGALVRILLLINKGVERRNGRAANSAFRQTTQFGDAPMLSKREKEVLVALSHGLGRQGSADALGVDLETIKTHTTRARRKLRAKDTTHAVAIALRTGLIS